MDDASIVINRIRDTAELLYQNREREGILAVSELITLFQNMLQNLTKEQMDACGNFAVLMLKELLDAYENMDVLAMADCLIEKSMLLVQFIAQ